MTTPNNNTVSNTHGGAPATMVKDNVEPLSPEDVVEMARNDIMSGRRIRTLTERERKIYGNAALNVSGHIKPFMSAISMLHPFVDATAETCYVDRHGRVGLSYFFLYAVDYQTRATWLAHEVMHVLNNHFARADREGLGGFEMNVCGDLEINSALSTLPWTRLETGIKPHDFNYKNMESLEFYARLRQALSKEEKQNHNGGSTGESIKQDEDTSQGNPSGSGDDNNADASTSNTGKTNSGDNANNANNANNGGNGDNGDENTGSHAPQGSAKRTGNNTIDDFLDRLERDVRNGSKGTGGQNQHGNNSDGDGDGGGSDACDGKHSNNGKPCPMHGRAQACDQATESRSHEADEAGIQGVSESAQEIARQDVRSRMKVELENSRSRGNGTCDAFLETMISLMSPPKVDWRTIFRQTIARTYSEMVIGKSETTYKSVNRRYSGNNVIFPGKRDVLPQAMIAVDTSGSMSQEDYRVALTEIKAITDKVCRARNGVPMVCVDTEIKNMQFVRSVDDIDLRGGGGTDMAPAFTFAAEQPRGKRPDMVILATDGYIPWDTMEQAMREYGGRCIILLTDERVDNVPDKIKTMSTVIAIGENNQ